MNKTVKLTYTERNEKSVKMTKGLRLKIQHLCCNLLAFFNFKMRCLRFGLVKKNGTLG